MKSPKFSYRDKVVFRNVINEFEEDLEGTIKGVLQFGKTITYSIVTNDGKEFPLIRESSILKKVS